MIKKYLVITGWKSPRLSSWHREHLEHLSGPPQVILEDKNAVGEEEWKKLTFDMKKKWLERFSIYI